MLLQIDEFHVLLSTNLNVIQNETHEYSTQLLKPLDLFPDRDVALIGIFIPLI